MINISIDAIEINVNTTEINVVPRMIFNFLNRSNIGYEVDEYINSLDENILV